MQFSVPFIHRVLMLHGVLLSVISTEWPAFFLASVSSLKRCVVLHEIPRTFRPHMCCAAFLVWPQLLRCLSVFLKIERKLLSLCHTFSVFLQLVFTLLLHFLISPLLSLRQILSCVAEFLSPSDLIICCTVCRVWSHCFDSPSVWKTLAKNTMCPRRERGRRDLNRQKASRRFHLYKLSSSVFSNRRFFLPVR